MAKLTQFEINYLEYAIRPTKLGAYGFLFIYFIFFPLDALTFPTSYKAFWFIRLSVVGLNLFLLFLLEKKGLLKNYLNHYVVAVYGTALIGLWCMLLLSEPNEAGRSFYLYYVPMMMVAFSAFYYKKLVGIALICLLSILISTLIAWLFLNLSFEQLSGHVMYFIGAFVICMMYNYWVQKVRAKIIIANIQLEEQKEKLRIRIQHTSERNTLLKDQKKHLDSRLSYFREQLPISLQSEIMSVFDEKGLIQEEVDWQTQVFSKRQIQILTEQYSLKKDHILLLSGIYLSLTYTEIQESLFPHLSVRSVENMASSLRKKLNLPRGASLADFMDSI